LSQRIDNKNFTFWNGALRINGVNHPEGNMHGKRDSQNYPENWMKFIEPAEAAAGKQVSGSKKSHEAKKTFT
jgi:hypothetical protein